MKVFLQAAICCNLLSGIQASADAEANLDPHERWVAIQNLRTAVYSGPFAIDSTAPTGELRGTTFEPFDMSVFVLLLRCGVIKVEGVPYRLFEYPCGTARWSAIAASHCEEHGIKIFFTARDPYMQPEHAECYNQAWIDYKNKNRSPLGNLDIGRGWLRDIALENPEFDAIMVRDSIHLFSEAQIAELFQIGFQITQQSGIIIVQTTISFTKTLWHPDARDFMKSKNLDVPDFEDIFYFKEKYKAYRDSLSREREGVRGRMYQTKTCLPAIRNAAEQNGWGLQAIQIDAEMEHCSTPLTEEQLIEFTRTQIMNRKPESEQYDSAYKPREPSITLLFMKNTPQPAAEAE